VESGSRSSLRMRLAFKKFRALYIKEMVM